MRQNITNWDSYSRYIIKYKLLLRHINMRKIVVFIFEWDLQRNVGIYNHRCT